MKDTIKAASFELIQLGFRNGHVEVIATGDIKGVKTRIEGGTSIRLHSDRLLLTSVKLDDVMNAIRSADSGGRYATTA
jgi:hypothetical protein